MDVEQVLPSDPQFENHDAWNSFRHWAVVLAPASANQKRASGSEPTNTARLITSDYAHHA
jgi:hypothetical protein